MREEVVDVSVPGVDVAPAVEAPAFLVAVQRIAGAGDHPAAHLAALDDKQFRFGFIGNGQDVPGQVQVPGRLDQPPSCFDLGRKVAVLEVFADLA